MITTNLTGNLGNHMWQYSVCRIVAEKLGYDWGINPSPTHDYYQGKNQMYFMDVNFGNTNINNIENEFHEKWTFHNFNGENINVTMYNPEVFNIKDNTKLIGWNGAFGGIFQSERYFENIEDDVRNWFKIKPEYSQLYEGKLKEFGITLDDNTCVINFRGGEYRNIPKVLCRREYWRDSINHMLSINQKMKFIVVTDDPECSKWFMPFDIPTIHLDIGFDFYVVYKSKWTIISNSTFGWWASWLNKDSNKIIAPKYWASHNISDGFWSVGESYTKNFNYLDREGKIFGFESCKIEAENYYRTKGIV